MPISEVEAAYVRRTREYFSNIDLWPRSPRHVDPEGWLSNFREGDDRLLATSLLDSFLFIGTSQCETMVSSAFRAISSLRFDVFSSSAADYRREWDEFRSSVIITFPASRSDPAGSGHIFARAARGWVEHSDRQILEPVAAVKRIAENESPSTVVFVDDFSGSGDQFCNTWVSPHQKEGKPLSFHSLALEGRISEAYFIPALCTWRAKAAITQTTESHVVVRPAHLLPPRYSAAEDGHNLVPEEDHAALADLLRRYAGPAGYTVESLFGYKGCGLAISFEHSTPDNTLPIFNGGRQRPNTWRPLRSK